MKTKLFGMIIITAIALFAGYNVQDNQKISDLTLANVEALANGEETLKIGCDNYSVVIKCQYMCTMCYRLWTTSVGYGNSTGLKGQCTCGSMYY